MKKLFLLMAGLAVVAGLGVLWGFKSGSKPEAPAGVWVEACPRTIAVMSRELGQVHFDRTARIEAASQGFVTEVCAKEGELVREGQVLFRLDRTEAERALEEAETALEVAKARLGSLQAKPTEEELAEAEVAAKRAGAEARKAEALLASARKLLAEGLLNKQKCAEQEEAAELARLQLKVAEACLKKVKNGAPQEELARARQDLKSAEHRREDARKALEGCEVKSPLAGTVTLLKVRPENLSLFPEGRHPVKAGELLALVIDTSQPLVRVPIYERDVEFVKAGTPARVGSPHGGWELTGKVERIESVGAMVNQVATYPAYVRVEGASERLLEGMTVKVEIKLRQHDARVAVPGGCLKGDGRRYWVLAAPGNVRKYVKTGARDGEWIEITEGIKVGERVLQPNN